MTFEDFVKNHKNQIQEELDALQAESIDGTTRFNQAIHLAATLKALELLKDYHNTFIVPLMNP